MTERQEEQAALHALSALSAEEARLLQGEWRYDARMREEFAELEDAAAQVALLLPPDEGAAELRSGVLAALKAHRRAKSSLLAVPLRLVKSPWVAWAAAAAIALAALGTWTRNWQLGRRVSALINSETAAQAAVVSAGELQRELEKKLADATAKAESLKGELEKINQGYALTRMELAMLKSSSKRYEYGEVLVVWNQEKQEGMIELKNMPPPLPNKDYQLWVICKQQRAPVNAGVIKVDAQGVGRVAFKPVKPIAELAKFAISLEKEGGAPEVTGQIVLASQ